MRIKRIFYARPFSELRRQGYYALISVRLFYAVMALFFLYYSELISNFKDISENSLWPAALWAKLSFGLAPEIGIFLLGGCFLAPVIFPWSRVARGLGVIAALVGVASLEPATGIGHSRHIWIFASFWFFIFLPTGRKKSARVFIYRLVSAFALARLHWGAIYFCSAVYKLLAVLNCGGEGNVCIGLHEKLSYLMASEYLMRGEAAALGHLLIENPLLNIAGFVGVIWFQLSAMFLICQPRWVFLVGLAALAFHVGTALFLGVGFTATIACVVILFLTSAPRLYVSPSGIIGYKEL